jgi:Bacterial pre-peptidase C-terminal domain
MSFMIYLRNRTLRNHPHPSSSFFEDTVMRQRHDACISRAGFLAAVACLLGMGKAEAGAPRLTKLTPISVQRGMTSEIEIRGVDLQDAQDLFFYEPGLNVESIEAVTEEIVRDKTIPVESGTRLRVKLAVDDNAPLGAIGLRVQSPGGLSEYQRLFISPFPVIRETEDSSKKNDVPKDAQIIAENSTVIGTVKESYDVDVYRFTAKQGQRITAEIIAARVGVERGLPDLHLAILDGESKLMVESDDSALFLQDPVLSIAAPADGDYFVSVRHSLFNANNDVYALHIGDFLRPTAIYPAGGLAGGKLSVQVLGDPTGAQTQTLRLPKQLIIGGSTRELSQDDLSQDIAMEIKDSRTGVFAPTPNTIRVSTFGNVLESEPNDTPEELANQDAVKLPIAFNGIINKRGDVDCFKFKAKKGEVYRIHALASGLGTPVDPTIWIKPASGKGPIARSSDSRINHHGMPVTNGIERETIDPVLSFTASADGEYILGIEDERYDGGPDSVYRIECQPQPNAVFVYIPPEPDSRYAPQSRQTIQVPKNGRYNTTLSIVNVNQPYQGELELVAVGLPDGVEMTAPRITPELTRVPVVFSASESAATEPTFVEIFARPVATKEEPSPKPIVSGFRQHLVMNMLGNNDYYLHVPLKKLALSVTEHAPVDITVEEPTSALVQNGEMALKFKIHRHDNFEGPVTVMMEWKPNGVNTVTPLTVPADQTEAEYLISAAKNATAGEFLVTLTAVNGTYEARYRNPVSRTFVSAKPFTLNIAEPHLDARFPKMSVERGKTSEIVVPLNHLKAFSGVAKASLVRLPRGVEVVEEFQEITAEDKEVKFTLRASNDSLVGSYRGMTLEVTVQDNGQAVRQFIGSGTLRVDAQRVGKPAS